jgi:hypothetical protein
VVAANLGGELTHARLYVLSGNKGFHR